MSTETLEKPVSPARAAPAAVLATAWPTLWPHMVLPRSRPKTAAFPFTAPRAHYFYLGRNAIWALAQTWKLGGQEVLFPAYFHGVELEVLLAAGVRVRFFPVHDRMRVDPNEVAAAIGPETRGVYLIHYLGFPGPVAELAELCRQRGLWLVEDCALALLSCLGERPLGSFGNAAVFCLYKTLPTPNGGALVLREDASAELPTAEPPALASSLALAAGSLLLNLEARGGAAGRLVRQGIRTIGNAFSRAIQAERVPTGTQRFDPAHARLGMSPVCHRVLAAQDFAGIVERRRQNYRRLKDEIGRAASPVFTELPAGICPLFFPIQVNNKEAWVARLEARGIQAVNFWSLHHPILLPGRFPEVDRLRQSVLEVPCHQDLADDDICRIAQAVRDIHLELEA